MRLIESKALAWGAMLLVAVAVVVAVVLRIVDAGWEYSVLFCAFMMAFCHLMSLNLRKMSVHAARQLDYCAMLFGVLAVIGLVVLWILL